MNIKKRKEIRVFISSTFRDMQTERNLLLKKTFPELKAYCRKRGVEFTEVDLRWGITEKEAENEGILNICLAEIDHCRPYFIGLLGERYGWIPHKVDNVLISDYPWLEEYSDRCITELEIVHAVLRKPEMKDFAFFYFRDPEYINKLPPEQKPNYFSDNEDGYIKLTALKEYIRAGQFHLRENYQTPEEVCDIILNDLISIIDKEYPDNKGLLTLEQEALNHMIYSQKWLNGFVERKEYFNAFDKYLEVGSTPLILNGIEGSGKTTLLTNWAARYQIDHLDDFIVSHYVESTARSTDYYEMIRHIMFKIKNEFDISEAIPANKRKRIQLFEEWLRTTIGKKNLIIILDSFDLIKNNNFLIDFSNLLADLPNNIKIIISCEDNNSIKELRNPNWPEILVEPLTIQESKKLITEYLAIYSKKIQERYLLKILEHKQSSNPLFLNLLLNELRIFGSHDQLGIYLDELLTVGTDISTLFVAILKRYEKDYDESLSLVKNFFQFLYVTRKGLSENEILKLLSDNVEPLPRLYWSPLYLALEGLLINYDGLLNFSHQFVKTAVAKYYLDNESKINKARIELTDFFQNQENNLRKADELPWHYLQLKDYYSLKNTIADIEMLDIIMANDDPYEMIYYWNKLSNKYNIFEVYTGSINLLEKTDIEKPKLAYYYNQIAYLFSCITEYQGAELFYRRALDLRRDSLGDSHPFTALSLNSLASLLQDKGKLNDAEIYYKQSLEIGERIYKNEAHPNIALVLNNLATLYLQKGDFSSAETMFLRALKMRRELYGDEHKDIAGNYNNLAILFKEYGDFEKAETYYHKAYNIYIKLLGPNHPLVATVMDNLGTIKRYQNEISKAQVFYRQALEIRIQQLGERHPTTAISFNNIGVLLKSMGNYDEAEKYYIKALEIDILTFGEYHENTAIDLNNLGDLYRMKNEGEKAYEYYERALIANKNVFGEQHINTAGCLNNIATHFLEEGNLDHAKSLYDKALNIYLLNYPTEHHPSIGTCYYNLGVLYHQLTMWEDSIANFNKALAIFEKVYGVNHPNTNMVRNDLNNTINLI